ncbi:MAG TPA: DinB family protein [Isosphaeraceae bacterium]|jgi:uncharacterized damage-inducible protein DinB|nr:DinB family protein [Isosphaeraceae bacterium]
MSDNSRALDDFLAAPALLRKAVAGMTPEQLEARPVAGKWSTLEVVCHLADSDQAWCHRIKRTIAEDRPLLIGYDETRFTATLGYHDRDLEEELAAIASMRAQLGRTLRALPEAAWSRAGIHNERGLVTLAEMVRIEADHVAHHVGTIAEKRRALGLPADF